MMTIGSIVCLLAPSSLECLSTNVYLFLTFHSSGVGPFIGTLLALVFYKLIKILEYEMANPGQDGDDLNDPTQNSDLEIAHVVEEREVEVEEIQAVEAEGGFDSISIDSHDSTSPAESHGNASSKSKKHGSTQVDDDGLKHESTRASSGSATPHKLRLGKSRSPRSKQSEDVEAQWGKETGPVKGSSGPKPRVGDV